MCWARSTASGCACWPRAEPAVRFGLQVDFRNPPEFGRRDTEIYAGTIENVSSAESVGFDDVWLSEHHFAADAYCPSPLVAGAAIAARTRRLTIGQSVLLLPLHNPLRVAEDGAVIDLISGAASCSVSGSAIATSSSRSSA